MEDEEVLLCTLAFLAVWLFYGFKWAILIIVTIILVMVTIKAYVDVYYASEHYQIEKNTSKGSVLSKENEYADEFGRQGRTVRTITRRYNHPSLTKRDLAFTDLQMNRGLSTQKNHLRSPQPLMSQINRHLSFNNMTYLPDQSRNLGAKQHQTSLLNSSLNNSHLLSPISSVNTSQVDFSPRRKSLHNLVSSPAQERYSPRCFSLIDPALNRVTDGPSMVKISQPADNVDGSPSFESILQKRLSRTKETPCSRHSVLTALSHKANRKRQAHDSEGSFLESSYAVKKRRRDDLDDFLDAVSDPLNDKSYNIKSLKRPSICNEYGVLLKKNKQSTVATITTEEDNIAVIEKGNKYNELNEELNTASKANENSQNSTQDSGVVLSMLDDMSTVKSTVKAKKRKSVTFSKGTKTDRPSPKRDKVNEDSSASGVSENRLSELNENAEQLDKEGTTAEYSSNISVRFFPNTSLGPVRLSPIAKPRKTKVPVRSTLTWKDLQESRREAWRRSQKLLDDIEKSIAQETARPSSSDVSSTTSNTTAQNTLLGSNVLKTIETTTSTTLGTNILQGLSNPPVAVQSSLASTATSIFPTTTTTTPSNAQITVPSTQSSTTLNQCTLPPASQSTVPFGQSTVPSSQSTVPASTIPSTQLGQSTVVSTQSKLSGQNAVPFGQSTLQVGQNAAPSSQGFASSSFTFVPSTQSGVPSNVNALPLTQSLLPAGQTTALSTRILPPAVTNTNASLGLTLPTSAATTTSATKLTNFNINPLLQSTALGFAFGNQTGVKPPSTTTNSIAQGAFGVSGVNVNSGGITGASSGFNFAIPEGPVQSSGTVTKPMSSAFTGFGSAPTAVTTQSTTFGFKAPSTQSSSVTQSSSGQANFGIFAQQLGASQGAGNLAPQNSTALQTFKFQPSGTGLSQGTAATGNRSAFGFQPNSQTSSGATGLFNAAAGIASGNTASGAGFTFGAKATQVPGTHTSIGGGSSVQQKSGGFPFIAPAVSKPATISGGFNFGSQAGAGFSFGCPSPGGFAFGTPAVAGAPFAASTPMPGMSGIPAFGTSGTTGSVIAKTRQRSRRARK